MRDNGCACRWCAYDREFAQHIEHVPPEHREFFEALKENWEAADHEGRRLERLLATED